MNRYNLALAQSFIESHVEIAAREMETLDPKTASLLLMSIPVAQARRLLIYMLPSQAARLLGRLPADASAAILAEISANQVASILRLLAAKARLELLPLLPEGLAARCRRLLLLPEDSVGAWMTTDILLLPENITAADALHRVADAGDVGDGNALPLVDDAQKLVGFVGIRDLLRARPETRLSLLKREITGIVLSGRMSLRSAERHSGWQHYDNLIVLTQQGQPEGLLRHVDLRRGMSVSRAEVARNNQPIIYDLGQAYLGSIAAIFNLVVGQPPRHIGISSDSGSDSR